MKGKTIGVISIKGGVGKTTVVANLATALAKEFGKKVLAIDANFTAPNLGIHVGVVSNEHTLHDALKGKVDISKAVMNISHGFDLIPASLLSPNVDVFRLKRKVQALKDNYDVILIDSSPNLNDEILATMMASDELLVVSSPDYPTLSCTMHAIKVAKSKNVPITGLVLNRVREKGYELKVEEIEDATGIPVIGWLPEDEKVIESLAQTTPAVAFRPNRDISIEYKKLSACLVGEQYKDRRLWSNVKKFFIVGDVNKAEVNREVIVNKL